MSILKDNVNKIIKKIKKGKSEAFKELHDATYCHLKFVAFNYLADANDIEDVLNETYFRIYMYVQSADTERDGYNWMCRIVQHLCYDYNEKRGVCDFSDRISRNKLFYDIEDTVIDNSQLYMTMQNLDCSDREILYLTYWEGMSLTEIARKTNLPKSSIYKRLTTLLKDIKEKLL